MHIVRRLTGAGALALALATGGILAAGGAARAQTPVTLQYWVYSDFAQGDALNVDRRSFHMHLYAALSLFPLSQLAPLVGEDEAAVALDELVAAGIVPAPSHEVQDI